MSDQALDPRAVDRLAVKEEFFRNIQQHTLDDVNGVAPKSVQLKLREKANLKQWAVALEMLHQKVANKEVRLRILQKKLECSDLKQAEAKVENMMRANSRTERGHEAALWFQDQLKSHGFEFPAGTSTKEMDTLILASVNSKLTALLVKLGC